MTHWEIDRIYIDDEDFLRGCNDWLRDNPEWEPIEMSTLATGLTWLTVKRQVGN